MEPLVQLQNLRKKVTRLCHWEIVLAPLEILGKESLEFRQGNKVLGTTVLPFRLRLQDTLAASVVAGGPGLPAALVGWARFLFRRRALTRPVVEEGGLFYWNNI
jgi:hypothetical protein